MSDDLTARCRKVLDAAIPPYELLRADFIHHAAAVMARAIEAAARSAHHRSFEGGHWDEIPHNATWDAALAAARGEE